MATKSQLPIVQITGVGIFAPILGIGAEVLRLGFVETALSGLFALTIVYFIVTILGNKRWDGAKKFGWIAAMAAPMLIFPLISWVVAVYFWWTEIRERNKWADLAR